MKRPPVSPILVLALGILAVSTASIFIRFAQQEAPSLVIAAWRLGLATLVLAPAAMFRRREEIAALKGHDLGLALLAGIFLAVHFAAWISSLAYTSVTSSVVLVSTAPLWVALLSPVLLKEPITRAVLLGMCLAMIGGMVVGISDSCTFGASGLICPPVSEFVHGKAFWGDLLALVGAWAVAGYLIIGRRIRGRVSLLSYIFVVYGMAALALVGAALAAGQPFFGYTPFTYLMFLCLAMIPQLLGHSTFNYALAYLSAAFVSVAALGEPVGSTILAYFLLGEMPGAMKLAGAALILAGIYIASRSPAPAEAEQSHEYPVS
jgi:drug/metabolite transporter (DMT)-like permease